MRIVDIRVSVLCWGLCFALGATGAGCVNERGLDEDAEQTSASSAITADPGVAEALEGDATLSDLPGCSVPKICGEPATSLDAPGCSDPTTCGQPATSFDLPGCPDPTTCGQPATSFDLPGCPDPTTCGQPGAVQVGGRKGAGPSAPTTECPNPNDCTQH
jgi:hypothetical protein